MARVSGWYEVVYKSGRVVKMHPKNDTIKTNMLTDITKMKECGSVTSFKWESSPRSSRY